MPASWPPKPSSGAAKRQMAGLLHFCGLSCSKPHVPTTDSFADIEKLTLDPYLVEVCAGCLRAGGTDDRFLGRTIARRPNPLRFPW